MKKSYMPIRLAIITVFICTCSSHSANVREYETTRMMATGGAGVGALLHVESSFLNPAPLVFFNNSSLYYQRSTAELSEPVSDRTPPFNPSSTDAFVAADASSAWKGALSYVNQKEFESQRKRYGLNFGGLMGESSAIGFGYRYTIDNNFSSSGNIEKKYHQVTIGSTHIINENLSMGAVLIDPFKSNGAQYTRFLFGMQYTITEKFLVMADAGANYEQNISNTALYRLAAQFNFFSYVFVRAGIFHDKSTNLKGNGYGVSWIGPKLGLDFAVKTSKAIISDNTSILGDGEQISEMALSVSLRF